MDKVVLLDCDNVLASMDTIHDLVKQKFGSCEGETAHYFEQYLDEDKARYARRLMSAHGKWTTHEDDTPRYVPGIASRFKLMPGALEGVRKLKSLGFRVVVLTSPVTSNITWAADRNLWLAHHFGIPHRDVIYAKSKSLVFGDAFVDDKAVNVKSWSQNWPSKQGFVYDHQFTREDEPDLPRFTWHKFLDGEIDLG